ncbi:carboxymuconolactone decarboxylase family protein [Halolamina salifodinae]|uniref:Alkylhydroperoxidase family enzyme n=1 Tax=Halolamina salifodinae TaxID=1202767 RepID=A0A8T4GUW0_9EURY|nr:carboxymuconolactone decarboxylase family protein [Halolamina salifodinae]MBP1986669.1 alkylhydroperoxidase family enzyme [Halolamina salifodinae]
MARIPYLDPEDLPEEYRDLVISKLQGKPVNVYAAIGNNPEVLAGTRAFLSSLWESSGLEDRDRELVILLAAAENDCRYEWHQHVGIGGDAGVTKAEMAAIADGDFDSFDVDESDSDSSGSQNAERSGDGDDALLLWYATAVLDHDVDDDLHDEFVEAYDESTAVGVASLASGYTSLAGVLDALDVGLEEGEEFAGWDPR